MCHYPIEREELFCWIKGIAEFIVKIPLYVLFLAFLGFLWLVSPIFGLFIRERK